MLHVRGELGGHDDARGIEEDGRVFGYHSRSDEAVAFAWYSSHLQMLLGDMFGTLRERKGT